jgi:autotransporter-associated beta strand protein
MHIVTRVQHAVVGLAILACLGWSGVAEAQTARTWNVTSGIWQTNSNWLGGSAPSNNTTTNSALFAGAANESSSLNAAASIAGLTFSGAGTKTISSDSTTARVLTLGASGITVNATSGAVTLGNATNTLNLEISANQTWTNNSANLLTVLGTVRPNVTTAGTFTLTVTGSGNTTLSGALNNNSSRILALTKTGTGALTLGGANTLTGAATISSGGLILDYSAQDNSKLADAAALTLGSGSTSVSLTLSGGSHLETVGSTTLGGGYTTIARSAGSSTLRLNAITRSNRATIDFGAASLADTDTLNDATGILGPWATVGGTDWAMNSTNAADGAITAYTGYTDLDTTAGTDTANSRITASATLGGSRTTNTLKIENPAASQSLAIGTGNTLTLTGGGLLATGANATTISGGSLTAGNGAGAYDLIVQQYNTGGLTISSAVTNNGANAVSLTKSGPGRLVLSAAPTYTGNTVVNSGTLTFNPQVTGSYAGAAATISSGGALELDVPTGVTYTFGVSGTGSSLSGAGQLVKSGSGTLIVSNNNNFSSWQNAAIILNSGTLRNAGSSSNVNTPWGANNVLYVNGDAAFGEATGNVDLNSLAIVIASGKTLTILNLQTTSAGISGGGAISVPSGAQLRLTAAQSSFAGGLTVAGRVDIFQPTDEGVGSGNITFSGASPHLVFHAGGTFTSPTRTWTFNASPLRVEPRANTTINSPVLGNGTVNIESTGIFTLGNSANTFSGRFNWNTASGARLSVNSAGALGTASLGINAAASTGTLFITGAAGGTYANAISLATGTSANAFVINVADAGNAPTWSGLISGNSAPLTKDGPGRLDLSNASNSFAAGLRINNGTLGFADTLALGSGTNLITLNASGSTGRLAYTANTNAAMARNITVASGTGTLANLGSGTLTLSGTLTKNGTILRFNQGAFSVSGRITGANANSDLYVDGANVTLSNTNNDYNGPTFVYGGGTLALGASGVIPNGSPVTLGDSTTRGTLDLGTFTEAINQLAFSGSGGTVRMAANQTASPQLNSTSSLTLGSNASLDLSGMQTTAGNYRLISASSLSGTFGSVTGLDSNYLLRYGTVNANEVSAQRKAEFGTITATPAAATIITGGSTAFGYTVANLTPTDGSTLSFTSANGSNVAGASSGTAGANATSASISGLVFTGTSVGMGQTGSFTLTDPEAIGSPAAGSVSVNVLDHALPGFLATGITNAYTQDVLDIDFGEIDESAGMQSFAYNLLNLASQTYGAGLTAGLDFTGVTADGDGFASGLTTFNNLIGGGTSSLFSLTFTPTGQGTFSKSFTLSFFDNRNLAGAVARRDLTINAEVIVVPEPGAIALAGIGIAAAAYAYRRRK